MKRILLAVLLVLSLAATACTASAASLTVVSKTLMSTKATHPCPGTATAVPVTGTGITFQSVTVTLPAGCGSRPVSLAVFQGATVLENASAVSNAAGVATISYTGTYTATTTMTAMSTVSGWSTPVAWSFVPPPVWCTVIGSPGVTCTATVALFTGRKGAGTTVANYYDVVVQTTSATDVRWEVGFNLRNPFYGAVPTQLGNSDLDNYNDGGTTWDGTPANDAVRQGTCSAGQLLVRGLNNGPNGNNFQDLQTGRDRRFSFVVNRTEAGYNDVLSAGCA